MRVEAVFYIRLAALNTVLPDLDGRIRQITEALEAEVIPFPGSGMSLGDIDRRLAELEVQFQRLLEKAADDPIAYGDQFKEIYGRADRAQGAAGLHPCRE